MRSGSGAEMQRGGDATGRGRSGARLILGCGGAGMLRSIRRRCGWLLLQRGGPLAPHSSVPLWSFAQRDGVNEGIFPDPPFRPLSVSHLLTSSSPNSRPPLPSPQPTCSELRSPSGEAGHLPFYTQTFCVQTATVHQAEWHNPLFFALSHSMVEVKSSGL